MKHIVFFIVFTVMAGLGGGVYYFMNKLPAKKGQAFLYKDKSVKNIDRSDDNASNSRFPASVNGMGRKKRDVVKLNKDFKNSMKMSEEEFKQVINAMEKTMDNAEEAIYDNAESE